MSRPTIFISYSHRDEYWKDQLAGHLKGPVTRMAEVF